MNVIFLIGFMGSGKTTVGRQLAKKLNAEFLDTDEIIEQQTGITISEIFARDGEAHFRDLETGVLRQMKNEIEVGKGELFFQDKTDGAGAGKRKLPFQLKTDDLGAGEGSAGAGAALRETGAEPTETVSEMDMSSAPGWTVVSVGGGLPVREENRALMHEIGTTFFLQATEETLVERLSGSRKRPLLQGVDLRERIRSLSAARLEQYLDAADFEVSVDHKSPGRIADEIAELAAKRYGA